MSLDGEKGGEDLGGKEYGENILCENFQFKNNILKRRKGDWEYSSVEEDLLGMLKILLPPPISQKWTNKNKKYKYKEVLIFMSKLKNTVSMKHNMCHFLQK